MKTETNPAPPIRVALLAVPEVSAGALYGLHEVFSFVGTGWAALTGQGRPDPRMVPRVVAASRDVLRVSLGVPVTPSLALDEARGFDIVLVPDLAIWPDTDPRGFWPRETAWLRERHAEGATVASICTGSVMLAEAGLLDGREATSHWGVRRIFEDRYPAIRFRPEPVLCPADPEGRIITSGGQGAWTDLALHLIARYCGREEALRTARVFLFGDRSEGQLPFAAPLPPRGRADASITLCLDWIAEHYETPNPVARLAAMSRLPPRTFQRRFRAATGYTPLGYVQALRVEEAKQLLETTDMPTDEIALAVGYEDPASFRQVFRRLAGVSPARYRQRTRRIAPDAGADAACAPA